MKYLQENATDFCFSSLDSAIFASVEYVKEQAIASHIKESFVFESKGYANII